MHLDSDAAYPWKVPEISTLPAPCGKVGDWVDWTKYFFKPRKSAKASFRAPFLVPERSTESSSERIPRNRGRDSIFLGKASMGLRREYTGRFRGFSAVKIGRRTRVGGADESPPYWSRECTKAPPSVFHGGLSSAARPTTRRFPLPEVRTRFASNSAYDVPVHAAWLRRCGLPGRCAKKRANRSSSLSTAARN